jgi:DNA-binding GntR family transcriptional regulator
VAPKTPSKPAPADTDRLFLAIARDSSRLPVDVSERDLMQRYGATRPVVQRVLTKLADVAAVQRKPGHGSRFQPIIADADARHESYRYRILIEPGFRLDPTWAAEMHRRHQEMMALRWSETASIALASGALFEVLAGFPPSPLPVHVLYSHTRQLIAAPTGFIDWMAEQFRDRLR